MRDLVDEKWRSVIVFFTHLFGAAVYAYGAHA